MSALGAIIRRDISIAIRVGGGALVGVLFFLTVVIVMPFAIGPDPALLKRIGPAILWLGAMLASLLTLDRLFTADQDDGSLDLIACAPLPLEMTALAKIAAHWLSTGLPLTLLSPLLAVMFNLSGPATLMLFLSLLIGTPAVSAVGAIGAGLTLSLKRGGLILPLIILPLLTPVVIFGAGSVAQVLDGLGGTGALELLAAFAAGAVLLSPFAAAAGCRLNLGS